MLRRTFFTSKEEERRLNLCFDSWSDKTRNLSAGNNHFYQCFFTLSNKSVIVRIIVGWIDKRHCWLQPYSSTMESPWTFWFSNYRPCRLLVELYVGVFCHFFMCAVYRLCGCCCMCLHHMCLCISGFCLFLNLRVDVQHVWKLKCFRQHVLESVELAVGTAFGKKTTESITSNEFHNITLELSHK